MGNLPVTMFRRHAPREIKPLTEFLENSEAFKKASLGLHNSKHSFMDKFWESLHEAAFDDKKGDKRVKLIDSHRKNSQNDK